MENNNKHIRVILTKEQAHSGKFEIDHPIDAYDFVNYYPKTRKVELPVVGGGTAIVDLVPKDSSDKPNPEPSPKDDTSNDQSDTSVYNTITLTDVSDNGEVLVIGVRGNVGETVKLGDLIANMSEESRDYTEISEDGNLMKAEVKFTLADGSSSISDYMYTIKENWHEETINVTSSRV